MNALIKTNEEKECSLYAFLALHDRACITSLGESLRVSGIVGKRTAFLFDSDRATCLEISRVMSLIGIPNHVSTWRDSTGKDYIAIKVYDVHVKLLEKRLKILNQCNKGYLLAWAEKDRIVPSFYRNENSRFYTQGVVSFINNGGNSSKGFAFPREGIIFAGWDAFEYRQGPTDDSVFIRTDQNGSCMVINVQREIIY